MNIAHHDAETFSLCDLTSSGAYVYGQHPSTGLHCLSYELPGWANPVCWKAGDADPRELLDYVANGGALGAWNSQFEEHAIWRGIIARTKPHWPQPRTEQFHDVMAWAYAASLPGSLKEAAKALGMEERKDEAGNRVMKQLMRPRKIEDDGTVVWWTPESAPEKFERLYAYCDQDVIVEREAAKRLRPLSPAERQLWLLDQRINQRGVLLDSAAVRGAASLVKIEAQRLSDRMRELTGCAATNVGGILKWLRQYIPDQESLTKADLAELLARPNLPDVVREVLKLRAAAGKASTAKISKMLSCAGKDGRVRGMFQYHRATTGRWAGSLIQLHNMPRPKLTPKEAAECIALFNEPHGAECIELGYAKPMEALSWCLRGMLIPAPGHRFIGGDFANIESRVIAWLAGETWLLDAYRDYDLKIGPDLYKVTYGRAFDVDPATIGKDDDRRQLGKVMMLAFAFGGGVGSFRSMAKNYNADLSQIAEAVERTADPGAWARAEKKRLWLQVEHGMHADLPPKIYTGLRVLVDAWREAHPYITAFWKDLEECALSAIKYKSQVFKTATGLISFVRGEHFLYCRLPSGRVLSYARPSVETVINELTGNPQQVVQYWAAGKDKDGGRGKKDFAPVQSYGGLLAENCLAGETLVFTCDGLKRLDEVTVADRVFDGVEYVAHQGLVAKGNQRTIGIDGVRMTSEHKVLTGHGWKDASSCEGLDRLEVRAPHRYRIRRFEQGKIALVYPLRMWIRANSRRGRAVQGEDEILRVPSTRTCRKADANTRHVPTPGFCCVARNDRPLLAANPSSVAELWRPRHFCMLRVGGQFRGFLARHGANVPERADTRAQRRKPWILAAQLRVGDVESPSPKQARQRAARNTMGPRNRGRSLGAFRHRSDHTALPNELRMASGTYVRSAGRTEPVYDLLNCGPRNRFMVLSNAGPLIVHNCTQAAARDCLSEAMQRLESAGYPVVLHVHDEARCEVPNGFGSVAECAEIMGTSPRWAGGLPIAVECNELTRYHK